MTFEEAIKPHTKKPMNEVVPNTPQLFEPSKITTTALIEASKTKAASEIQAAMVVAKRFPRDENAAFAKIMRACKRTGLAEISAYEYKRGGTSITGPSIHIAKAIAQAWGNIQFGWRELDRHDGESTCEAFAWDIESNTYNAMTFTVKHWRDTKEGGYALKDERDIYELCANQAARRMRACLLSVIPGDIVDAALAECEQTLKGDSKEPIQDRVRKMLAAFAEYGVTTEMMETRLGHKLDATTGSELAKLKKVYISIRDGVGKVEEHFKQPVASPKFDDDQIPDAEVPAAPRRGRKSKESHWPLKESPAQAETTKEERVTSEQPESEPPPRVINYASGLRKLLAIEKITEGEWLNYLNQTAKVTGLPTSLEDLVLSHPDVAKAAFEEWTSIVNEFRNWVESQEA